MKIKQQSWNKLVRDNIPKIIEENGGVVEARILEDEEFDSELRRKIVEEANEVMESDSDHLIEELGDILTVINALVENNGISKEALLAQQNKKDVERGAFSKRIYLMNTKEKNVR